MEVTVKVPSGADRTAVVGAADRNLKLIREALGVRIAARDGRVSLSGAAAGVHAARRVIDALVDAAEANSPLKREQVLDLISEEAGSISRARRHAGVPGGPGQEPGWGREAEDAAGYFAEYGGGDDWADRLNVYVAGKPVRARTPNQEAYLRAIREFDLVFGLGPAGTGKTYLAVAAAVHMLRSGSVKRLVLTRPAVEAGEKLGYLPGDLREKVNPYLRPLFDALNDMMDFATARRFMENDVIEVCPLAFMRGRTLNQSVIILDEAQNATKGQMKMFLTRMGQGSKMIVTGDPSQTDLPDGTESGLIDGARRLARTEGVAFVGFEPQDVVRHALVKRVIAAYDAEDGPQRKKRGAQASRGRVASDNQPDNTVSDVADGSMGSGVVGAR
ncbi:MAG: PhoH family protein [Phycisphaerales bacterium]